MLDILRGPRGRSGRGDLAVAGPPGGSSVDKVPSLTARLARIPRMTPDAQELFERSIDDVRRGQVRPALIKLLDALAVDPTHAPSLESAGRICRLLGAEDDARLFEAALEAPDDAETQFALGYRMVDQDRSDVARAVLERCLALDDRPSVRRELAFALLLGRDFAGCLRVLTPLEELSDELADPERLEVILLQAEAAFYARKRGLAQRLLERAEQLVPSDEQRARIDGLHELIGRSMRWDDLEDLDLRAWHFVQHAGVILKTAGGHFEDSSRGGRFDMLDLRADMVAFLIQRLVHLLERFEVRPGCVVSASETADPIAWALAHLLDVPLVPDLDQRGAREALFVAAGAGEFAPWARDVASTEDLHLFAVHLDWDRDEVVCPEVVGVLARRVFLPWEPRFHVDPVTGASRKSDGDRRPAADIAAELVGLVAGLPDDGGVARAEFEERYEPWRDALVLDNPERHPFRRQFTRLSPWWPAADEPKGTDPLDIRPGDVDLPDD